MIVSYWNQPNNRNLVAFFSHKILSYSERSGSVLFHHQWRMYACLVQLAHSISEQHCIIYVCSHYHYIHFFYFSLLFFTFHCCCKNCVFFLLAWNSKFHAIASFKKHFFEHFIALSILDNKTASVHLFLWLSYHIYTPSSSSYNTSILLNNSHFR